MRDDLIARLEAATELTLELFVEVQATLRPSISDEDWARSYAMVRAEAYESAALTLVPEGLMWTVSQHDTEGRAGAVSIFHRDETGERVTCCPLTVAATPALAIVIAALKASGQGEG